METCLCSSSFLYKEALFCLRSTFCSGTEAVSICRNSFVSQALTYIVFSSEVSTSRTFDSWSVLGKNLFNMFLFIVRIILRGRSGTRADFSPSFFVYLLLTIIQFLIIIHYYFHAGEKALLSRSPSMSWAVAFRTIVSYRNTGAQQNSRNCRTRGRYVWAERKSVRDIRKGNIVSKVRIPGNKNR